MFRLTRLNFKNAIVTSETLFGLGLELAGAIFAANVIAGNGDSAFELSSLGYLPWIAGVFIAFALTIDNDSGAVRSRLIAGYTKPKILLAQVLAGMLLSLVYMFLALIPIVIPLHETIMKHKTVPQLLWGLLVLACGFILTAALAAVISTVIFSRAGAILLFIVLMIGVNLTSAMLFEITVYANSTYYANYGNADRLSQREPLPDPVRYALKVYACSSTIVQGYLYDEVSSHRRNDIIEEQKKEIAYYEEHFGKDPKFTESHYDELEINQMRSALHIYEEQDLDYRLLPLYSLGLLVIITTAGAFVYKRRNVE